MIAIAKEIERCKQNGIKGVLATIILSEGSTYQKEGAKCFLTQDGQLIGLVSGGCVESDIIEYGKQVMNSGKTKRLRYDLRDNGDEIWGLGVGCNGAMEVFLQPYDPIKSDKTSVMIEKMFSITRPHIVYTIVASEDPNKLGEKQLIPIDEALEESNSLEDKLKCCLLVKSNNSLEIFMDLIEPPPSLVIFGAGPDAIPLVNIVKQIGWFVTVVDHRPGFVTKENFPSADQLMCSPIGEMPDIGLEETTYTVIMSHHFLQDQMVLQHLLLTNVPYIGLLGPRKRTAQLLESTHIGNNITPFELNRIFSPVGLDLGAKTPEEIAFSIAAELMTIYRKGNAVHLKNTAKGLLRSTGVVSH